jgi:magnesium-transporting ATPase (P-type)
VTLSPPALADVAAAVDRYAAAGLRVLAIAERAVGDRRPAFDRAAAEADLTLLGLVAMVDPPRGGVAEAVASAHRAGIRVHVVTGDYGPTAAEIARQVGIGTDNRRIVTGDELDVMSDSVLDRILAAQGEIVFARSSPEGSCGSARRFAQAARSSR